MKIIYSLIILLSTLLPCVAQTANEQMAADTLAADTLITDSLLCDSISNDASATLTVQQRIEKLLEADMFRTSQLGLMIYDLTADTLVYAHNERQTMRPASTMKVLTAITALDRLGGSFRYSTSLNYKGSIYDGDSTKVMIGDLILKGGMDPRLSTDDVNAFVESVQKLGVDTIYGEIREDRSFKDSNLLGEGWCWDDDNPVLTPMLWNRKDMLLSRFCQALREGGITVLPRGAIPRDSLGRQLYVTQTERTSTLCTRHHSIDQILVRMMKQSDNLYAESMFYQIAASAGTPARAKSAAGIMKQLIKKIGLDPSRYRIADGSGLSLYNYQSAELQIALLRYAYRNPNIYSHLFPAMPSAGVDGTLQKRMTNSAARGNVHAKTGTLTGISSLTGYLTAENNHVIGFSIINQGVMHASNAKSFQDRVCTIMCGYK